MSCGSLLSYQPVNLTIVNTTINYTLVGSTALPGYTTPGWTSTTHIPNMHWNAHKGNCIGGLVKGDCITTSLFGDSLCSYVSSNCAYTDTLYTATTTTPSNQHSYPGIQLWPSTNTSASVDLTMNFLSSAVVVIPPPPGQLVVLTDSISITISNFNIMFGLISINIPVSETITIQGSTAGFEAQISLPGSPYEDSQQINFPSIGDVTYSFTINPYILLCATPTPPVSLVNFVIDLSFSVSFNCPITNVPISFSQNFSVACPAPIGDE